VEGGKNPAALYVQESQIRGGPAASPIEVIYYVIHDLFIILDLIQGLNFGRIDVSLAASPHTCADLQSKWKGAHIQGCSKGLDYSQVIRHQAKKPPKASIIHHMTPGICAQPCCIDMHAATFWEK
jgi:hypothetical protein